MGDIFSLMNEEVDAGKFDGVRRAVRCLLIRQSMKIDEEIASEQYLKDLKFKKKSKRRHSRSYARDGWTVLPWTVIRLPYVSLFTLE